MDRHKKTISKRKVLAMPANNTKKNAVYSDRLTRSRERMCSPYYRPEYAATAKEMVAQDFSDEEICGELGVACLMLERWQLDHPELRDALHRTEQQKTALAEKSLQDLALGHEVEVKKVIHRKGKETITVCIIEQRLPDLRTLMFILNNMCPKNWQKDPDIPSPSQRLERRSEREILEGSFWHDKIMEEIRRGAREQLPLFEDRWGNDDV